MRLRSIFRTLSFPAALVLLLVGSSPSINAKHHTGGGDQPIPAKADPKPPIALEDTGKSGFAKLVVRNLGAIVNSSDLDFAPTITADGHTMFFVTDRRGGVGVQDFWMTISPENNDTAWGGPLDVTEINSVKDDGA